ncbi:MAG TPA: TlpA disulfide reductase family protein [Pyrinomonadaceae bacterium]|nr:TlpA disulfide reductase family protein [Pyrinomonadaceae bacterium]
MALKKQETGAIKFWTPLRVVSTLIVLGLLAAFGVSSCNSNDPVSTRPTKPNAPSAAGNEAAAMVLPAVVLDSEMKSTNGEPIKLSNYSGKVLLVNLWATWCGPCRRETPELVRLHQEYRERGLEIVGLTTEDPVASEQTVQEFVRSYNVGYPVGWATRDVALALMRGRNSIPQSFIVTRDGRIAKHFVGFDPRSTPPLLKQAIENALSDTVSSR